MNGVGVVIIGRNPGPRLTEVLRAAGGLAMDDRGPAKPQAASQDSRLKTQVYVDSASSDGSADLARQMDVAVVELDPHSPMNAALARNAGFEYLQQHEPGVPGLAYVQFVDGDCVLEENWLATAQQALASRPELGVVCGILREKDADRALFKRICDLEWRRPIGPTKACGGIFMVRAQAFADVGGFTPTLAAGEEGELCRRLRDAGWAIERLNVAMAEHDIGPFGLRRWWRRTKRSGWAYAQGYAMGGRNASRGDGRAVLSILAWGAALPIAAIVLGLIWWPLTAILLLYVLLWYRVYFSRRREGIERGGAALWAAHVVLGKFVEVVGILHFGWHRLLTYPGSGGGCGGDGTRDAASSPVTSAAAPSKGGS